MVRFPPCQSFEPVPASPAQRSGRGFGPRDSSGTLQLSTRCSSADLLLSRSLAVRAGSAANCFRATTSDDALSIAATEQLHPSNIATTRLMLECIVETARASIMQRLELPSMLHSKSSPRLGGQSLSFRSRGLRTLSLRRRLRLPRRTIQISEAALPAICKR
jgi:hypothetical protein